MKKIITMLLALCMIASTVACSSGDNESSSVSDSNSSEAQTSSTTVEKQDVGGLQLPLTDETEELTVWCVYNNNAVPDPNDLKGVQELERRTNVHINWIPVTTSEASEKQGILFSSGDLPDIMYAASFTYPGGLAKGVEDGVIADMDPLIREYMPNYMAILNSNEVARRQATSDEDKLMAAYVMVGTDTTIESEGTWNGLAYRKDLFDPMGLELPETVSEWHDVLLKATHDEKMPVLLWIHGGALMGGYGYEPEFDGEAFCREGVILVTINYRLGILGFFNHPDLSRESPHHVSGNYGHLDQVAALKWIRRNIKNFGGDPNNITIFGQSAGAASVQDLLVSPLTRGDIAGVIIQSSASIEKISKVMAPTPLEKAERSGVEYAESLGCSTVEELRELPWKVLDEAIGPQIPPKYYFGTIIDGYFLQHTPSQAYFCGEFPDIPIMVGNTSGEANMFGSGSMPVKEWERLQECLFGNKAQAYMELAQVKEPEDIPRVIKDTHTGMVGNRALCELVLRAGHAPAYLYVFDHDLPGNNDGSFHSSELWYVFGTFERCWRPMTGTDFELSRAMTAYWANFAKRKNPNGEKLPTWKPYTETDRENMLFQEKPHCEQVEENPLQAFVLKYIMED